MGNTHTKTFLELNGRRYDAHTGRAVDGFLPVKPQLKTPASTVHHTAHHERAVGHSVKHHSPQRSSTLMRQAVKRPHIQAASVPAISQAITEFNNVKLAAADDMFAKREARAHKIHKSKSVSHFGGYASPAVAARAVAMPVKPAPAAPFTPQAAHHAHHPHAQPTHTATHAVHKDPIAEGLRHAQSHRQPTLPKRTRTHHRVARKLGVASRTVAISAAVLAIFILGGFFAYQNVPNLSMRIADAKAGIPGKLPNNYPSGFAMSGPIQYSPGQITINFKANADNRQFQVTQQASKWDNDTLVSNFVSNNDQPYQTYHSDNKTIYIYGNSNATWINNGVWYQISGNSSLNNDQLLHIANSM